MCVCVCVCVCVCILSVIAVDQNLFHSAQLVSSAVGVFIFFYFIFFLLGERVRLLRQYLIPRPFAFLYKL